MSEDRERGLNRHQPFAIYNLLSTVFLIGFIPVAPGTFGSLAGAIFIYLLKPPYTLHIFIIAVVLVVGLWSSGRSESCWGKDSKSIVIDEFLGQMVALLFIPINLTNVTAAFVLFRFFDILKPYPIREIEKRLKGARAIIFDDVAAGIGANLTLQIAIFITQTGGS